MSEQTMPNEQALAIPVTQNPAAPVAGATMWNTPALMRETFQMARALAESDFVPQAYRGKPANCIIAMDVANQMGLPLLMVLQNIHVIQGKPSWSGSACKAMVDHCGRFRNSRFEFVGAEGTDAWGCRLVAERVSTGETTKGETVTIAMAKKEGWYSRGGSKWPAMPGQMLRYRAAAFFARAECPESMMGLQTDDEAADVPRAAPDAPEPEAVFCEDCGQEVTPTERASVAAIVKYAQAHFNGKTLCADCQRKRKAAAKPAESPVDAPTPPEVQDTTPDAETPPDEWERQETL